MTRHSTRPFVTWIAIFAVLLHALLPYAHAAQAPAGMLTTLCSPDGNNRLVFIPVGEGEIGDPPVMQAVKCPLCLAGAHYALADLPVLSFTPPERLRHVLTTLDVVDAPSASSGFHFSSRAPPQAL